VGGEQRSALWLYTSDCDAVVEAVRAAGGTVVEEPADQPWGERIARVADPDGNRIIVGQASRVLDP
jgi:predicted enzyme related to lactoylglutathione lyase